VSKKVLVIKSSARGAQSASSQLVDAYIAKLGDVQVLDHNVGANPLPALDGELLSTFGVGSGGLQGEAKVRAQLADSLISQLQSCDELVIGAGMYNFGVPAVLKNWFDHVMQAGRTFRYTEAGTPEGLVKGRKAVVFVATGGVYSQGAYAPYDFCVGHIRAMLGFIGITDVTVIRAEGLALGDAAAKAGMESALAEVASIQV
jgi:FMN-dependent NADH-azoreductase